MGKCVRNLANGFVRHYQLSGDPPYDPQTEELIEAESLESAMPPAQIAKASVPLLVTATQAKLALIDAGLYEYADGMVSVREGEPGGYRFRVVWDAANWYRSSPELNAIAADMGLTEEQVDGLFIAAAGIDV